VQPRKLLVHPRRIDDLARNDGIDPTVVAMSESALEVVDSNDSANPIYVCRMALTAVRVPSDVEFDHVGPEASAFAAEVESKFRAALAADPRVSELIDSNASFEVDNARTRTLYQIDAEASNVLDSVGAFQGLTLNSVIVFRVRVPKKNQPKYRSMDDVPADDYLAAWDGLSLAVQWNQTHPGATGSGGHVVLEILEQAGEKAEFPVSILTCTPSCLHRFLHLDFVTFEDECGCGKGFHLSGETPVGRTVIAPFGRAESDVRNLYQTFFAVSSVLHVFAETRSDAEYILHLAYRSRIDSSEVLYISYQRADRSRLPDFTSWVKDLWDLRGSRREARRLIAGIWLALAMIDARLGTYLNRNSRFNELVDEKQLTELRSFLETEHQSVADLDLAGVRASLQETATRMEGRLLIAATFGGAAAALIGASVAALLT
jgi:hypothetical protein